MLGFGRQRKSFSSKTRKHSNTSPEIKNEILPSLEQEQQQQQGRGGVQDDNIKPPHFAVTTHGRKDSSSPSSSSSSSGPSSNSNCSSENSSLYEANSLPKNPPSAAAAVFGQAPGMITSALNNISFNPIPTTSGKCSKLKINVFLDSTIYVAGGNLHGRLELVSSVCGSLLRIGEIAIELCGYEGKVHAMFVY